MSAFPWRLNQVTQIEDLAERLGQAKRECARIAEELETKRAEAVELAHKEAQYRSETARIEEERRGMNARADRIRERVEKTESEHEQILEKIAGVDHKLTAIDATLKETQETRGREESSLAELRSRREELEAGLEELRGKRESLIARRETLRDLEAQYEGLDAGVRKLLEEKDEGVLGTVADLIEVDPSALPAVEPALGEAAGYVVCRDSKSVLRAAGKVRNIAGRTGIISLDECRRRPPAGEAWYAGVVGRASDLVRCAEDIRPVVEALLGDVWVTDNLQSALAICEHGISRGPLVTRDGNCVEGPGILRVGRGTGPGLLSRKTELRKLELEIEGASGRLSRSEEDRTEVETRTRAVEEKLEQVRQRIYEAMVARTETVTEREQLQKRRLFLEDELEGLKVERTDLESQQHATAQRADQLEKLLESAIDVRRQIESEAVSHVETEKRYGESLGRLQEEATSARVRRGQEEERAAALQKAQTGFTEEVSYVREAVHSGLARLEEIRGRKMTTETERAENHAALQGISGEMEDLRGRTAELERASSGRASEADEIRGAASGLETKSREIGDSLQNLRVEESEHRVREQNLVERAQEEYGIEIEGQTAEPEEETDWEALASEVEGMKRRIQSYAPAPDR